jgi:fructosamine-3-kinase
MVLKECLNAPWSEPHSLELIEMHMTIPAPRVVDAGEHNDRTFLIMTHLAGQQLGDVAHLMSYAKRDRFADDLAACVSQL